MKVFLTVTEAFKAEFKSFCEVEAVWGQHATSMQKVTLLDAEFVPSWVADRSQKYLGNRELVFVGSNTHENSYIYVSCKGNWISLSEDGSVRVGGRRHGIPFARRSDVLAWEYPVGGTLTPHLSPFDHPDEKYLAKLAEVARKHDVEVAIAGIEESKRLVVQKAARLNGYNLERAKEFLRKTMGVADYEGLFSV